MEWNGRATRQELYFKFVLLLCHWMQWGIGGEEQPRQLPHKQLHIFFNLFRCCFCAAIVAGKKASMWHNDSSGREKIGNARRVNFNWIEIKCVNANWVVFDLKSNSCLTSVKALKKYFSPHFLMRKLSHRQFQSKNNSTSKLLNRICSKLLIRITQLSL